jgi:hypothetical protein
MPCFVRYSCVSGLYLEESFLVTASILSATPTNFIAGPLAQIFQYVMIMPSRRVYKDLS